MGAKIWELLNSQVGLLMLGSVVSMLWAWAKRKDARAERFGRYLVEAFDVAEKEGLFRSLKGAAKYEAFAKVMTDAMRAGGLGKPSARELAVMEAFAARRALLAKPSPKPPPWLAPQG